MKILFQLTSIEKSEIIERRNYQANYLGSQNGDTVIAELFQYSSKSLDDKKSLEYFKIPVKPA